MTVTAATAAPAAGPTAAASPAAGSAALGGLASNFQNFLSLLMTQLKNQDPTSPLDTNQFTQELVQFTSVEQQINTNSSLAQLIQLTQSGQMLQAAGIVGHQVEVAGSQLALQDGTAGLRFEAPSPGPVTIGVFDAHGAQIASAQVTAQQGSNDWSWDGGGSNGRNYPDGAYTAAVAAVATTGQSAALPFTILGKATAVQTSGAGLKLDLGSSSVDLSALRSVIS